MSFFEQASTKAAVRQLEPNVSMASTWMAPPDQRNFISPEMIQALAMVLMGAFLAGVQEQALGEAKEMGKGVVKWLSSQIRRVFDGAPAELDEIEAAAEVGAKSLSEDAATKAEAMVVRVLVDMMPEADAQSLARSVRVSVETNFVRT